MGRCLYLQRLNFKSSLQAATRCVWAPLNRSWTGKGQSLKKEKTGSTKVGLVITTVFPYNVGGDGWQVLQ